MDTLKRKLEEQLELADEFGFGELYLTIPVGEARRLEKLLGDPKYLEQN